jgi:hypothetical protein
MMPMVRVLFHDMLSARCYTDACVSSDEGSGLCWHWRSCVCDRARDVRGAWVGCLMVLLLCITVYPFNISMAVSGYYL